jgi:cyclic pyranopterin phosphate synthase
MSSFTHIDQKGRVKMVDVTDKDATRRTAVAQATISVNPKTLHKIMTQAVKKGNVFETARIAGIMAAKKTAELIPMCHPLNITHVSIDFVPNEHSHSIHIEAAVRLVGQTGVEMEALTAVSVAALTIYDMCKSYDREMVITHIQLVEKTGGKSGQFLRERYRDSNHSG